MKLSKRFTKFTLVGLLNTLSGYILFVLLSNWLDQLLSFAITEIICQNFKYLLYKKYVFIDGKKVKNTYFRFWKATLPYSMIVCINVLILRSHTPAYVTGMLSLAVAVLYYQIYKLVFHSTAES
ncbi:GtrA family protein [bacterium]|nr:GtrA family protein [bacterium]